LYDPKIPIVLASVIQNVISASITPRCGRYAGSVSPRYAVRRMAASANIPTSPAFRRGVSGTSVDKPTMSAIQRAAMESTAWRSRNGSSGPGPLAAAKRVPVHAKSCDHAT
jgi:hypothetical protein